MVGSVSSRCSGMSPCSPPVFSSGGEHGLIPEQRLDTEPKKMVVDEKRPNFVCIFLCGLNLAKLCPENLSVSINSVSNQKEVNENLSWHVLRLCTYKIAFLSTKMIFLVFLWFVKDKHGTWK